MNTAELFPIDHIRIDELYQSRKRVLEVLSGLLADDELGGEQATRIFEALVARERLGCTAIGHGIAIPHGRVAGILTPRGAVIRLREGIDFCAPDTAPVTLVIGLVIPEDYPEQHLEILGRLARHLNDPDEREAIMEAQSAERVQALMVEWFRDGADAITG
ncbi:MAG TPA: PTS sugar transporter subunit IIA [Guyparkeria sp.]|nr:PTS sugar transporter subunit IIA [Guyparkeria sp.]